MLQIQRARLILTGAIFAATFGAVFTARAQEPSAAAVAAARELVDIRGGANIFETVVFGVVESAKGVFLQTSPALSKDLEEVAGRIRTELAPRRAELVNEVARIYAQRFTEQELREATAFFKTPLGRKIVTEEPGVLDQSFQRTQQWASKLSEEVLSRYRAEMKKKGHNL